MKAHASTLGARCFGVVALVSAIASVSCGDPLTASGTISEWKDAPPGAHSTVFLGGSGTIPAGQFVTLDGVEVTMKAELDPATSRHGAHSFAYTNSDAGGLFKIEVMGLKSQHASVSFRKVGFEQVSVETSEANLRHVVVALVRER
jgi:hypothetical protein